MAAGRLALPSGRRSPVAGACAVGIVGGLLAAAVATAAPGHERSATLAAATVTLPARGPLPHTDVGSTTLARLLVPRTPARPVHASRTRHRAVLDRPPQHRWVRPFWGVLSSPFGMRWGRLHAGIDLAGPYGAPIVAATDGCISYAGPMAGYGEVMMIDDWDGTQTVYGHMSSFVHTSGCVTAGETIARIGTAGDATGPHLHFEVRVGGVPIDPLPFLARRGVHVW